MIVNELISKLKELRDEGYGEAEVDLSASVYDPGIHEYTFHLLLPLEEVSKYSYTLLGEERLSVFLCASLDKSDEKLKSRRRVRMTEFAEKVKQAKEDMLGHDGGGEILNCPSCRMTIAREIEDQWYVKFANYFNSKENIATKKCLGCGYEFTIAEALAVSKFLPLDIKMMEDSNEIDFSPGSRKGSSS